MDESYLMLSQRIVGNGNGLCQGVMIDGNLVRLQQQQIANDG